MWGETLLSNPQSKSSNLKARDFQISYAYWFLTGIARGRLCPASGSVSVMKTLFWLAGEIYG
jgi:hypothetical protein